MMHQWDADAVQLRRRPDSGEQQQVRGFQATSAEHDLLSRNAKDCLAALDFHPHRPCALEEDAPSEGVRPDSQVQPMASWIEVRQGRTQADAVGVIHRHGTDAARLGAVHIRVCGEA